MITPSGHSRFQAGLCRLLDIAIAGAALLALAPLMLIIAGAIMAESGRPVLFAQTRIGRGGQRFIMYKFRKFDVVCGDDGCPLTLQDDVRMTRLGRMLARTKLDELPQLFNILRGDMAVVGPRPESLAFADCFTEAVRPVLHYRPGIFGPSQVTFRCESALYPPEDPTRFYRDILFPAKASLDLAYYPRRTVLSDLGWIVLGVLTVVRGAAPSGAIKQITGGRPPAPERMNVW
jgi:lipopolysaccharide/colanic/teichoic acid biosynthesis glycosyltransferase